MLLSVLTKTCSSVFVFLFIYYIAKALCHLNISRVLTLVYRQAVAMIIADGGELPARLEVSAFLVFVFSFLVSGEGEIPCS